MKAEYEPMPGRLGPTRTRPTPPPWSRHARQAGEIYAKLVEETILLEGPETIAALITEPVPMSAGGGGAAG